MNLAPGQTATDAVIVANAGKTTATLQISPSTAITAPNSGSAFGGFFQKCVRVGCWVTGLPSTVTLKPGERETLRFTIDTPKATPLQQYLAGITARPATPPPAVSVGSNGQASAKAVIINQITVGVAITVGSFSIVASPPSRNLRHHDSGRSGRKSPPPGSPRSGGLDEPGSWIR